MIDVWSVLAAAPPLLAVPNPLEGWAGWLLALVVLAGPTSILAWRSHRALGHWQRYFAQWRRVSWWAVSLGSAALALAAFALLGALPAWDAHWAVWQQGATVDPALLAWLNQTRGEEIGVITVGALALLAGGLTLLLAGVGVFLRRVLVRRQPVSPTAQWLMQPPGRP